MGASHVLFLFSFFSITFLKDMHFIQKSSRKFLVPGNSKYHICRWSMGGHLSRESGMPGQALKEIENV